MSTNSIARVPCPITTPTNSAPCTRPPSRSSFSHAPTPSSSCLPSSSSPRFTLSTAVFPSADSSTQNDTPSSPCLPTVGSTSGGRSEGSGQDTGQTSLESEEQDDVRGAFVNLSAPPQPDTSGDVVMPLQIGLNLNQGTRPAFGAHTFSHIHQGSNNSETPPPPPSQSTSSSSLEPTQGSAPASNDNSANINGASNGRQPLSTLALNFDYSGLSFPFLPSSVIRRASQGQSRDEPANPQQPQDQQRPESQHPPQILPQSAPQTQCQPPHQEPQSLPYRIIQMPPAISAPPVAPAPNSNQGPCTTSSNASHNQSISPPAPPSSGPLSLSSAVQHRHAEQMLRPASSDGPAQYAQHPRQTEQQTTQRSRSQGASELHTQRGLVGLVYPPQQPAVTPTASSSRPSSSSSSENRRPSGDTNSSASSGTSQQLPQSRPYPPNSVTSNPPFRLIQRPSAPASLPPQPLPTYLPTDPVSHTIVRRPSTSASTSVPPPSQSTQRPHPEPSAPHPPQPSFHPQPPRPQVLAALRPARAAFLNAGTLFENLHSELYEEFMNATAQQGQILSEERSRNAALVSINAAMEKENAGILDHNKALLEDKKVLIDHNKSLGDTNRELMSRNAKLTGSNQQLTRENDLLSVLKDDLRNFNKDVSEALRSSQAEADKMRTELDETLAQNQKLAAELDSVRQIIYTTTSERDKAKEVCIVLMEKLKGMRRDYEDAKTRVDGKFREMTAERERLEAALREARKVEKKPTAVEEGVGLVEGQTETPPPEKLENDASADDEGANDNPHNSEQCTPPSPSSSVTAVNDGIPSPISASTCTEDQPIPDSASTCTEDQPRPVEPSKHISNSTEPAERHDDDRDPSPPPIRLSSASPEIVADGTQSASAEVSSAKKRTRGEYEEEQDVSDADVRSDVRSVRIKMECTEPSLDAPMECESDTSADDYEYVYIEVKAETPDDPGPILPEGERNDLENGIDTNMERQLEDGERRSAFDAVQPTSETLKLGPDLVDLLYMTENDSQLLACRMCVTRAQAAESASSSECRPMSSLDTTTPSTNSCSASLSTNDVSSSSAEKRKSQASIPRFTRATSWCVLIAHCRREHPKAYAELEGLSLEHIQKIKEQMGLIDVEMSPGPGTDTGEVASSASALEDDCADKGIMETTVEVDSSSQEVDHVDNVCPFTSEVENEDPHSNPGAPSANVANATEPASFEPMAEIVTQPSPPVTPPVEPSSARKRQKKTRDMVNEQDILPEGSARRKSKPKRFLIGI